MIVAFVLILLMSSKEGAWWISGSHTPPKFSALSEIDEHFVHLRIGAFSDNCLVSASAENVIAESKITDNAWVHVVLETGFSSQISWNLYMYSHFTNLLADTDWWICCIKSEETGLWSQALNWLLAQAGNDKGMYISLNQFLYCVSECLRVTAYRVRSGEARA
jgi:hypothetical protein